MITLEKIDQIVERTGVTYTEAKIALEKNQGDVIEAIIYLEQSAPKFGEKFAQNINLKKDDVFSTLRDLIRKGNITKIILEKEGKTYLELPVNVVLSMGAMSVIIAQIMLPIIAIVGTGLYIGNFRIKVLKDDGSEVDVNEETQKRILLLKGKVEEKKSDFDDEDVIDITNISTKTQTDNKEE